MQQLSLKYDLPFTTVTIAYNGRSMEMSDVLVDTGSASTILAADMVANVQIIPRAEDILHTIHGVGGSEVVFSRRIDYLKVGERSIADFEMEVGGMDYGFKINGILGMDFLTQAKAVINLQEMRIEFAGSSCLKIRLEGLDQPNHRLDCKRYFFFLKSARKGNVIHSCIFVRRHGGNT